MMSGEVAGRRREIEKAGGRRPGGEIHTKKNECSRLAWYVSVWVNTKDEIDYYMYMLLYCCCC